MNPLTKEQAAFADEHHRIIYVFLREKRYSVDEFFGVAAHGYLRAVRTYTEREDLRSKYAFSTIAFQCMRSVMSNHFRDQARPKRRAVVIQLNEELDADDYADSVWDSVMRSHTAHSACETIMRIITPSQRRFAMMRADGYSDREIAARCGTKPSHVTREIEAAADAVINMAPELLELIAA